jgi:hypothetical protein
LQLRALADVGLAARVGMRDMKGFGSMRAGCSCRHLREFIVLDAVEKAAGGFLADTVSARSRGTSRLASSWLTTEIIRPACFGHVVSPISARRFSMALMRLVTIWISMR